MDILIPNKMNESTAYLPVVCGYVTELPNSAIYMWNLWNYDKIYNTSIYNMCLFVYYDLSIMCSWCPIFILHQEFNKTMPDKRLWGKQKYMRCEKWMKRLFQPRLNIYVDAISLPASTQVAEANTTLILSTLV